MNGQDFNNWVTTSEKEDQANPPSNAQNANADPVGETMPQEHNLPGSDAGAAVDLEKEPLNADRSMTGTMEDDRSPAETSARENAGGAAIPLDAPVGENGGQPGLLNPEESERFRHNWQEIQSMFIDDPQAVVRKADALVAEVIDHLTQGLGDESHTLAGQWNEKNDLSTEDLRLILQRYRVLFNRIVD